MRFLYSVLVFSALVISPCMVGCGPSRLSEDETAIEASDAEPTESPVNDANNP